MEKKLRKVVDKGLYHFVDGVRIAGAPSGLRGDVSGLWGDVSGLRGDVSGLWGDVSGLWGDVDDCGLTKEERDEGVDVQDLIAEES